MNKKIYYMKNNYFCLLSSLSFCNASVDDVAGVDVMEVEGAFFDTEDYQITTKKLGKGSYGEVFVVQRKSDNVLYSKGSSRPQARKYTC